MNSLNVLKEKLKAIEGIEEVYDNIYSDIEDEN